MAKKPIAKPAPKPAPEPAPEPVKPVIAEATGMAVGQANKPLGREMEAAMQQAVLDIQTESEAIWADPNKSEEVKRAELATLNAPENVKSRMTAARLKVKEARKAGGAKNE